MDPTNLQTLTLCAAALGAKYFATSILQGLACSKAGMRAPEDRMSKGVKAGFEGPTTIPDDTAIKTELAVSKEIATRWTRIVANDAETIPLCLVLALIAAIAGADSSVFGPALVAFTVGRFGHTISYAARIQVLRAVSYLSGWACICMILSSAVMKQWGSQAVV